MTKEEAKQKLRKHGYNVIDDNSVVTVVISPDASLKTALKDVKDKLSMWGYNASFGIRQQKGAENIEQDDVVETVDDLAETEAVDSISDTESATDDNSTDSAGTTVSSTLDGLAEEKEDNASEGKKTTSKKTKKSAEEEDTSAESENDSSDDEFFDDEDEYFDDEDSDMLLTEDSIQFSLEDFGLDF